MKGLIFGILRYAPILDCMAYLETTRSPRMSAPSLPHLRFVLNRNQRKRESLFLSSNNFFNFKYSGFNIASGPVSPSAPLSFGK